MRRGAAGGEGGGRPPAPRAAPAVPAIQVRNLDFSYGPVQVLFGVDLDVRRARRWRCSGPTAPASRPCCGSSAGSGSPSRGVSGSHGRTITYADPELRSKIGIVQLMGGNAVFPSLSVDENLRMAGFLYRRRRPRPARAGVARPFPELAERRRRPAPATCRAASSRCWPWPWRWCTSPRCCSSTSCRSGWRRSWCRSCSAWSRSSRTGADDGHRRAVAQRRPRRRRPGRVHGEGRGPLRRAARELAERDDLARAVFLGGEGAADPAARLEVPAQVVLSGACGPGHRRARRRRHPHLPVVPGHQLRPRRAGRPVRGPVRPAHRQLALELLRGPRPRSSAALSGRCSSWALVRRLSRRPGVVLLVATIGAAQLLLFAQFVLPDIASYSAFPTAFTKQWTVARRGPGRARRRPGRVPAAGGGAGVVPRAAPATAWPCGPRPTTPTPPAWPASASSGCRRSCGRWPAAGRGGHDPERPAGGRQRGQHRRARPGHAAADLRRRRHRRHGVAAPGRGRGRGHRRRRGGDVLQQLDRPGPGQRPAAVVVLVAVLVSSMRQRGWATRAVLVRAAVRPVPAALRPLVGPQPHPHRPRRLARPPPCAAAARHLAVPPVPLRPVLVMALVALSLTVLTGWAGQLSLGPVRPRRPGRADHLRPGAAPAGASRRAWCWWRWRLTALAAGGRRRAGAADAGPVPGGHHARPRRGLAVDALPARLQRPRPLLAAAAPPGRRRTRRSPPAHLLLRVPRRAGARRVVSPAAAQRARPVAAGRARQRAGRGVGLSPTRVKLFAFAVSGGIAGLAGGLLVGPARAVHPRDFTATDSLQVVAIAVVGGLASITGTDPGRAVRGRPARLLPRQPRGGPAHQRRRACWSCCCTSPAGWCRSCQRPRRWPRLPTAPAAGPAEAARRRHVPGRPTSSARRPGGARPRRRRRGQPCAVEGRRSASAATGRRPASTSTSAGRGRRAHRRQRRRQVDADERGRRLRAAAGHDRGAGPRRVGGLPPARRAGRARPHVPGRRPVRRPHRPRDRAGRGRGPGARRLRRRRSGPAKAGRAERAKRAHADEILDFLGLGAYAERFVAELSTGTRRIVELACLLAIDARVLCLDEPTAGIAQREAEAFGPLLLRDPPRARRLDAGHRARHAAGHVDQRPHLLPRGRPVIADGPPDAGAQRPAGRRLLPRHRRAGHRPQRRRSARPPPPTAGAP